MTKENSGIDDNLNFTRDLALFYFGYRAFIKQEDDLVLLTEFVKYIGELYFSLEDFLA